MQPNSIPQPEKRVQALQRVASLSMRSTIGRFFRRIGAALCSMEAVGEDPADSLLRHQWADLPPDHPVSPD